MISFNYMPSRGVRGSHALHGAFVYVRFVRRPVFNAVMLTGTKFLYLDSIRYSSIKKYLGTVRYWVLEMYLDPIPVRYRYTIVVERGVRRVPPEDRHLMTLPKMILTPPFFLNTLKKMTLLSKNYPPIWKKKCGTKRYKYLWPLFYITSLVTPKSRSRTKEVQKSHISQ